MTRLADALADRYRLERELGAGGMATVYLAEDLKHGRRVAIKVLKPELAAVIGAERFVREIRTIAALQHPHILGLIDSGEVQGTAYYVMPFVEGESLRDRLNREKQLPVADAVRIASEVAGALDYAHRHGVIHRDIKPENILLHDGQALVADFGIALAASSAGGSRMTETGMSLGTPHYMSPEQAMGEREITARSDIYALGCVTYEMLVGEPPFTGPTAQAIVVKVMTEDPRALTSQRRSIPAHVEDAVTTALEKLPADRFASAHEFAVALGDGGVAHSRTTVSRRAAPRSTTSRDARTWWIGAVVCLLAFVLGWLAHRPSTAAPGSVQFEIQPDSGYEMVGRPAISPDGSVIAFWATLGESVDLFIRQAGELKLHRLARTTDGDNASFSPDGAWIGYTAGGNLLKIPVVGGVPVIIAKVPDLVLGTSWSPDGFVLFANGIEGAIYRVPVSGGTPELVLRPDTGQLTFPQSLPGGERLLITQFTGAGNTPRWRVYDLKGHRMGPSHEGGLPHYVSPGRIVYGDAGFRLVAQWVAPKNFEPVGVPEVIADSVRYDLSLGLPNFAMSPNGSVVIQPSRGSGPPLEILDRTGRVTNLVLSGGWAPRFSPNGRQIAFAKASDLWIFDRDAGTTRRLTTDSADNNDPQWSPDGQWIAYSSRRDSMRKDLYVQPSDGSGESRRILRRPLSQWTSDWSRDGEWLVFTDLHGPSQYDIWMVPARGGDPAPWIVTNFDEMGARVSPNGRWAAYTSNETGRYEVYIQSFPKPGTKILVSVDGGVHPVWRPDGRELYYWAAGGGPLIRVRTNNLIAVSLTWGSRPAIVRRDTLFRAPYVISPQANYDVDRDGQHFVAVLGVEAENRLNVHLNALGPPP
jgi:Tol biopolymer transport system component/tRNA A-37 threonylcarbamoyl transferase component Bud32